jgi:hypothetical protein
VTEGANGPEPGDLAATDEAGHQEVAARCTNDHTVTARGVITYRHRVVQISQYGDLFQVERAPLAGYVDDHEALGIGRGCFGALIYVWAAADR